MNTRARGLVALFLMLGSGVAAQAQLTESLLGNLKPRAIGPAVMAGRTIDFAVYEQDPAIFYVASASGGLLKTVNAGTTWENVFDRQNTVSIGDFAINPHDPNVVWVGTGEANNRQSSSWGDGIYKSTDGGKTWKNMGLRESHHIGRIVVNPNETDIVYVAALGHLWGPNRERGVFMTNDGGLTWQHVLAISEDAGAVDIIMDPSNPKVLYAATYQRRRTSRGFSGDGPGGGIHKTVDGGRTWRKLTNGLPTGDIGRIGLDIYRRDPNIVYAIVEAQGGGVFRSEDKGESWTKMNSYNPRPSYYSQLRIDPNDEKRIYVLNQNLGLSDDGGRTFREDAARGVHLDHHAMWIDPRNSRHLIRGNDGGVWVSRDRSANWEHLNNYATGQFYHISVDMQTPYWVYGGMQDNASWAGPSAVRDRVGILNQRWIQMLSCDGMFTLSDPNDHNTIYTNCQNGRIVRYDMKTGERKAVQPQLAPGEPPLRWNWTTPIVISPFDTKTLYTGANKVFKSIDRGHSWAAVSPDLTTQTAVERGLTETGFGNITALSESTKRAGLIYAGTDDGNVHVTRDGGKNWTNLTSRVQGVAKMIYVSRLTPSAADAGTVYASFDGHRSDDFKPYVFASTDFGATWKSITSNLPSGSVYTIKEDVKNPSVLYVGTEFGVFVSIDRGASWTRWTAVPTVAIYELVVHPRENDLVLGTHGRSILVIDDISPVQQLNQSILASNSHLFDMRAATAFIPNETGWFVGGRDFVGPNPEFGAYINYYLKSPVSEAVKVTVSDAGGSVVRELTGPKQAGIHRVVWDLRTTAVGPIPLGMYMDPNYTNAGPLVVPGEYTVKVTVGRQEHSKKVRVLGDPLALIADADRKKLFDGLTTATDLQSTATAAADAITLLGQQLEQIAATLKGYPNAPASAKSAVEGAAKQVTDLRTRLVGAGGRGGGGGGAAGIRNRINGLKGDLIGSQSLPTASQASQLDSDLKELNDLVAQLNTTISTTIPNLFKHLADNNIRAGFGEPIKPIKPVGR